jgi:hypothetical protein
MVVLEMVHEVSAVSFHLLIARHSAEHNLGETFTEKVRSPYCSNFLYSKWYWPISFLLLILKYSVINLIPWRSRSNRVLKVKLKWKNRVSDPGCRYKQKNHGQIIEFFNTDFVPALLFTLMYPDPIAKKILNTDPDSHVFKNAFWPLKVKIARYHT